MRLPMLLTAAVALPGACDYHAPTTDSVPAENVIAGSVVLAGLDTPANTLVLLYAADDPPPPAGTGRPLTFDGVSPDDYGQTADALTAPFSMSNVPDGTYLVTALVDVDADFHPLVDAFSGSTCGDWLGVHTGDLVNGTPSPVTVQGGQLADNVTVFVARENTWERPAFTIRGDVAALSLDLAAEDPDALQTFTLDATAVHAAFLDQADVPHTYDLEGPFAGGACETAFLAWAVDADQDGLPDPHPDFPPTPNLWDLWPRIYLSYLGVPQGNGTFAIPAELEGETWASVGIPYPDFLLLGEIPLGVPGPRDELTVVWSGAGLVTRADGSEEIVFDPSEIPAGAWAVTVVQLTGQTWTVPNTSARMQSTDASFDPARQAGIILTQ